MGTVGTLYENIEILPRTITSVDIYCKTCHSAAYFNLTQPNKSKLSWACGCPNKSSVDIRLPYYARKWALKSLGDVMIQFDELNYE